MKMNRAIRTLRWGLAWLCVCLLSLKANAGEPLELSDFVSVRGISALSFSPDELFLAWQATRYAGPEGPEERVWVAELESGQVRSLGGEGKSASAPKWRPGSPLTVSFLSGRDSEPAQIFVISVAGGEPRAITHSATAIKTYAWSPDGKRLAYIADVPKPDVNLEEEKDWRIVDRDDQQPGLWELEVESGKARLLTQGDWKVRECVWATDGKGVYFIGTRTPANDRHTDELFLAETGRRDSATDAAKTAIRSLHRLSGHATDLKISADGAWVSFIDARNGGDAHDLFLYSVKNGSAISPPNPSIRRSAATRSRVTVTHGRQMATSLPRTPADLPQERAGSLLPAG
jgi:Tol biopolymer transport system component